MVMVKIFCMIVGEAGSIFSVKIDDSESVEDLMEKIKDRCDGKIDAPWMDLQLFLAKKTDGTWLTKRDVLEVTSDLDPLDDMSAPLNLVGLSEEDVRYRITKEDIKAKKVPAHVLVVVPPEDYLRSPATILLATILPMFSLMPQRLSLTKTEILNTICATTTGATPESNPWCGLFDSTIKDIPLIELTDHHGNKVCSEKQTGVLLRGVNNGTCHFEVGTTFGDVDGSALTFTGIERPFYRCLNLQARVALMVAVKKGWINASYDFKDFWSEVSLDDKMEIFHRSSLNCAADL